jgi:prepilin-type N-terminal cleavage/methylation domain-containing protein
MNMKGAKMKRGFTMIELMLLVMVLGLLAVSIYPSIASIHQRALETKVVANMHTVQAAVEEYATMTDGLYPQDFGIRVKETNPMVKGNVIAVAGVAGAASAVAGNLLPSSLRNPVSKTVGWAFDSYPAAVTTPPAIVIPVAGGSSDQGSILYMSADKEGCAAEVDKAAKYVIWGYGVYSVLPTYLTEKQ